MTTEQIKTATLEQLYDRYPEDDVRKKERRLIKRAIARLES